MPKKPRVIWLAILDVLMLHVVMAAPMPLGMGFEKNNTDIATSIFNWNLSASSAPTKLPPSALAGIHPIPQMGYIAPNTSLGIGDNWQSPDWLTPTPLALGRDRLPGGIIGGQITDSSGRILDANSVADALVNGQLQTTPGVEYTAADQQNDPIFMTWYNALLKVGGQGVIDRAIKRRNDCRAASAPVVSAPITKISLPTEFPFNSMGPMQAP